MIPRRIIPSLTLLALLLAFSLSASHSTAAPLRATTITFTAEELLSRPTDTSININVIPDSAIELYYEYKVSGGTTYSSTPIVSAAADEPCNVVISGLSPDTKYDYRINYHLPGETDWVTRSEHSFHTQRPPGKPFTFVVTSDAHSSMSGNLFSASRFNQTLGHIAADQPDLWIDTGDSPCLDNQDTLQEYQQGYLNYRNLITLVSGDIPIFKVLGNHEQENGWNLDDEPDPADTHPVMANNARRAIFPSPKPDGFYSGNLDDSLTYLDGDHLREDYYAWTWGDALFIILDPYWYTMTWPQEDSTYPFGGENDPSSETRGTRWDWTLGIDQYLWLKDTLANSTALYKFVFIHHVTGGIIPYGRGGTEIAGYFEWGGMNWDGTPGWATHRSDVDARWTTPIHQLMDQYNVTMLFHGHDHFYAKQTLDDIVYQEVPMPAASDGFTGFMDEQTGTYASQYPDPAHILFYGGAEKHPNSGHLRVTVSPTEGVTVEYVDMVDGSITTSYTIGGEPPTCYALTLNSGANGGDPTAVPSNSSGCDAGEYVEGEVIGLTANPDPGYQVDAWSGTDNDSSTALTNQVTMPGGPATVNVTYEEGSGVGVVELDSVSSGTEDGVSSITIAHTVGTGANRLLLVGVSWAMSGEDTQDISSVTFGGVALTEVDYMEGGQNRRDAIYYLTNPASGTANVVVTFSGAVNAVVGAASFTGVDQTTPLGTAATANGGQNGTTTATVNVTTEVGDLVFDTVAAGRTPTVGAGQTALWNIPTTAGNIVHSAASTEQATSTSTTMSWNLADTATWGIVAVPIKAEPDPTAPRITISGTPLSDFTSLPGTPSAEQSYIVSGSNLTDDIVITPPADFEISLSSGGGWVTNPDTISLTPTEGTVPSTPIHVRFSRATEGTSSGNITHTSTDATTCNVAVSGTAVPLAPVTFNIILGRPTNKSVTANIIPDHDVEFYVEYGTTSGSYISQTTTYTGTADQPIEFVIGGNLSTNTRYFYHLVYRQTGTTDWNSGAEYSFVTQRAGGEPFTFTIASDSHLGQYGGQTPDEYALYEVTMHNIKADHPDFHIDDGDTFAMDPSPLGTGMTEAEAEAAYLVERPYMGIIGPSAPIYLAIGNHENEEGWNWDDVFTAPDKSLAIVGLRARKMYFPNPIPDDFYTGNTDALPDEFVAAYPALSAADPYREDYFAWTWGDALFVVIDPLQYSVIWPNEDGGGYGGEGQDGEVSGDRWDWTLGIEQYLWLKDTLENSDATFKFVFSHHVTGGSTSYARGGISAAPYFEWGGLNADDTWGWDTHRPAAEGWTVPIHQLFIDNGVDAYIHGHDHIYAYEELDGIAYLEVPKPDDAGYDWNPYGYGYNEGLYPDAIEMLPNSGYIRVTVSPAEATFEYVRSYLPGDGTNGEIAHSFTIPADAPGPGILGDVNGDEVVNSTDALIILSCDAGMDTSGFCPMNCGDVNADGLVNSTDALIILSYDAGMTVPYPVGEPGCPSSVMPCGGCTP
jgi:phosphodiesterase/alkaline phosphatase D-like protein